MSGRSGIPYWPFSVFEYLGVPEKTTKVPWEAKMHSCMASGICDLSKDLLVMTEDSCG